MKKLISLLFLLTTLVHFLYSQNNTPSEAIEYANQGMKLADQGNYAEAIVQYKKGRTLAPDNSLFFYEIALSYFSQKNYVSCIATLDSVIGRPDVNDQFYQLLGASWDESGNRDTALLIFKKGMEKFPKAANLSMECGVIEFAGKNFQAARGYWINGTAMNPAFPDNYYHLAKFYADSADRIPSILYCETYLNLTRNTAQVAEINKLLCTLYGKCIQVLKDSTIVLRFSDNDLFSQDNQDSVPDFCRAVKITYQTVGNSIKDTRVKEGIDAVIMVRESFLKIWFGQKYHLKYPFSLFDYEKQLTDAGLFSAYSRWLLMKCDVFAFKQWVNENKEPYAEFVDWYKKNPFNNTNIQAVHICK